MAQKEEKENHPFVINQWSDFTLGSTIIQWNEVNENTDSTILDLISSQPNLASTSAISYKYFKMNL